MSSGWRQSNKEGGRHTLQGATGRSTRSWISSDMLTDGSLRKGKYTVSADVFTVDHNRVTCLEAHVQF